MKRGLPLFVFADEVEILYTYEGSNPGHLVPCRFQSGPSSRIYGLCPE